MQFHEYLNYETETTFPGINLWPTEQTLPIHPLSIAEIKFHQNSTLNIYELVTMK